jgi:diacylglycerol kinase family enzyme
MTFTVLINGGSGTVLQIGADSLEQKLKAILGDQANDIKILPPLEFIEKLKAVAPDTKILIGGGDGTIRTAASILKDRNIAFGIIPLGTMNLFAKDLSLPPDPYKAAELYKKYKPVKIDSAEVNGEIFLCNAMVGMVTELAIQRETIRKTGGLFKWVKLFKSGLYKLKSNKWLPMTLRCDNLTRKQRIKAAIISNNEYEDAAGVGVFKKKSLSDGKLSVYTLSPDGTLESLNLLSSLAFGSWKNDPCIKIFDTKTLHLNSIRRKINVMLDGEVCRLRMPLVFTTDPASMTVLVPE